jgi:transcriptional regulator with XRE-family HTH domain
MLYIDHSDPFMSLSANILATMASATELAEGLAERARARRLAADLSQEGLASRAGITLSSLKRFERTGEISLERLIRVATALGATREFHDLFAPPEQRTLDEILARPSTRKRGRRR